MAGGDLDAAGGIGGADGQSHGRGGGHAQVEDVATGGDEAGLDGVAQHHARRPAVAADDHGAALAEMRSESLGEGERHLRRERLAHDAAHARDAHDQAHLFSFVECSMFKEQPRPSVFFEHRALSIEHSPPIVAGLDTTATARV